MSTGTRRPREMQDFDSDDQMFTAEQMMMSPRRSRNERYRVGPEIYHDILIRFGLSQQPPEIDGFADAEMHVCRRWWGPGGEVDDAFDCFWGEGQRLWLNPPYSQMDKVTTKVLADGAEALMLVPHWASYEWLHVSMVHASLRHFYAKGMKIFSDTGPTPWPVWALFVNGKERIKKFWIPNSNDEKVKRDRTKASERRWRRKNKTVTVC